MPVVPLVPVDLSIASSYDRAGKTGGPRSGLVSLAKLGKAGVAVAEMAVGLKALSDAVAARGGDFRVTECHRDVAVQTAARAKYDAWVAAGKPKPSSPAFDAKRMKAAFVALPGRSGHNAGRSIDVHIGMLGFPGVAKDKWLDTLWQICEPLGWEPIIKAPDEGASEAWHFDFWGELRGVKARLGYEQVATCGAILVGHGPFQGFGAEIQALLCRAGFDVGQIDGLPGPKTRAALAAALKVNDAEATRILTQQDASALQRLLALPAR